MPSNPRKNKSRAILDHHTRRLAEQACEHVLDETWELPGASGSQPKCGGDDHACAPAPDLATGHVTGFMADLALRHGLVANPFSLRVRDGRFGGASRHPIFVVGSFFFTSLLAACSMRSVP